MCPWIGTWERRSMFCKVFRSLRRGLFVVALLAPGGLISGCAGSQEPVSGSFVGETSNPVTSVAVVAAEPAQGEESREVRALIYGTTENPVETDGNITAINEWFVGSAT